MPIPNDTTRHQILHLLKKRGEMTASQLAQAIGITPMGIRLHLSSLERDGLAQPDTVRQKRGRPAHVFRLTPAAEALFPSRYGQIAVELLDQIAETDGEEKIDQMFERRMRTLQSLYETRLQDATLDEKVRILAAIRDEEGYMAEADTEEDEFILVEHHCPIYEIARKYTQACRYEQELFARSLDAEVGRTDHKIAGDNRCRYVIRKKAR